MKLMIVFLVGFLFVGFCHWWIKEMKEMSSKYNQK